MDLYEYAIIKFVPDVERGESINVGLVMMCKKKRWIRAKIHVEQQRVEVIASDIPHGEPSLSLNTFVEVANGNCAHGPMSALEVEERFRWLTAVKSCCLQTSPPHPGLTEDLEKTFNRLFERLVL